MLTKAFFGGCGAFGAPWCHVAAKLHPVRAGKGIGHIEWLPQGMAVINSGEPSNIIPWRKRHYARVRRAGQPLSAGLTSTACGANTPYHAPQ